MALHNLHKHLTCAFHPAVLSRRATLLIVDRYSVSLLRTFFCFKLFQSPQSNHPCRTGGVFLSPEELQEHKLPIFLQRNAPCIFPWPEKIFPWPEKIFPWAEKSRECNLGQPTPVSRKNIGQWSGLCCLVGK